MISIRDQEYGLDIALYNEFTLADFKLLETALLKRQEEHSALNLLLDLSGLVDFTLDMAMEEIRFMRAHRQKIGKVAIVVNDVWIKLATHIANLLAYTHTRYFNNAEVARAWLQ